MGSKLSGPLFVDQAVSIQAKDFKSYTSDRGIGGGLVHLTHTSRKALCFVLQAEIPALAELCNKQMFLPRLCALRQCTDTDVLSLGILPSPHTGTGESISGLPGDIPMWSELVYTTQ